MLISWKHGVSRDFTISQFNPYIEITNAYSYLSESMSIAFKRDKSGTLLTFIETITTRRL